MASSVTPWYSYPNSSDTLGIAELFGYVNTSADGMFFPVILLVLWVVSFIIIFSSGGLNRPAAARGFTFASFLCSVLGIPLSILGFLAPKFMYLPFILFAAGLLWLRLEQPSIE